MHNQPVTAPELTQALSRALLDVAAGRMVKKSRLQKLIDISDAVNRRQQVQINTIKAMIEAQKSGLDFAAKMKEVRAALKEVDKDLGGILSLVDKDED